MATPRGLVGHLREGLTGPGELQAPQSQQGGRHWLRSLRLTAQQLRGVWSFAPKLHIPGHAV